MNKLDRKSEQNPSDSPDKAVSPQTQDRIVSCELWLNPEAVRETWGRLMW